MKSETHWIVMFALLLAVPLMAGKKDKITPVSPTKPSQSKPLPGVTSPSSLSLASAAAASSLTKPRDMKLLVLTGDGTEPSFAALRFFFDHIGVPYDTVIAKNPTLPQLDNPSKGLYMGIVLATGALGVCDPVCRSALPTEGWTALDNYARNYGVRTVSYYTYPEPRYGLSYPSGAISPTDSAPAYASFLAAASTVFPYLNRNNPVRIANAYTYLAAPYQSAGETTTPILAIGGSTVGVVHKKADGREYMALTMDNSPYLVHSMAFNYGILNWVTKGVFLGARKIYLSPQSDDLFLENDLFDVTNPKCQPIGAALDPTFDDGGVCRTLRIQGADLSALRHWQDDVNHRSQFRDFRVAMAFNGFGTTREGGAPANDSLTQEAASSRDKFFWVNHTYDHENLDCFNPAPNSGVCRPATYSESLAEITQNTAVATKLKLPLDRPSMVTPGISGLYNPNFLGAAASQGIRYLVSDMSRVDGTPATPNTGIRSAIVPSILLVPRRATNVYYNVGTANLGALGSEPDEYNFFYGPRGIWPFFKANQTYQQIIDRESDALVTYMLRYEVYPSMFHQSNFWRYNGPRSLFSDLMDAAMNKFAAICTLPVSSLTQSAIGAVLERRMAYNAARVTGTLTPGSSIILSAAGAATVPVTGICKTGCESYGGQSISYIPVSAGGTVVVPVN
ncbi:MAG: hypothetical protein HY822_18740 [Acidobacteria bacterium]|nr:hypothetical protein [Acidobacteriota bacterium]